MCVCWPYIVAKGGRDHLANLKLLLSLVPSDLTWIRSNPEEDRKNGMMSPWHVMAIILPHLKLIKDNSLKSQLTQKLIAILITILTWHLHGGGMEPQPLLSLLEMFSMLFEGFYLTNLSSLYGCSITSRVTTEMRGIKWNGWIDEEDARWVWAPNRKRWACPYLGAGTILLVWTIDVGTLYSCNLQ